MYVWEIWIKKFQKEVFRTAPIGNLSQIEIAHQDLQRSRHGQDSNRVSTSDFAEEVSVADIW